MEKCLTYIFYLKKKNLSLSDLVVFAFVSIDIMFRDVFSCFATAKEATTILFFFFVKSVISVKSLFPFWVVASPNNNYSKKKVFIVLAVIFFLSSAQVIRVDSKVASFSE